MDQKVKTYKHQLISEKASDAQSFAILTILPGLGTVRSTRAAVL